MIHLTLALILVSLFACSGGGGGASKMAATANPVTPTTLVPYVFKVKPYLQMGNNSNQAGSMALLWQTVDAAGTWAVEVRQDPQASWKAMAAPSSNPIAVRAANHPAHWVWSTTLKPLAPGSTFAYRVLHDGQLVFSQTNVKARPHAGQPQRVVVAGDLVEGGSAEKAIAFRIHRYRPDYVVAAGDMVYGGGTIKAYQEHFFPTFNAEAASPATGAPLLRSTLMVGVLGNNDVADATRTRPPAPGGPGYYLYWNQPLNGPDPGTGGNVASLQPVAQWQDFLTAAGSRYPTMGTFSFDAGDAHWTILDSNAYMDWNDPGLLAWLRQDLAAAQAQPWRFVVFHHPAFNLGSRQLGWRQYRMRELWPIFEQEKVDLVFTGHIHSYQRTRPLRFRTRPAGVSAEQHFMNPAQMVIDIAFDGAVQTRANGPIQIVTGGGGAHNHGIVRPATGPRPHDAALVGDRHSFSTLELTPGKLVFRQLDDQGATVDTFTLTK